MKLKRTALSATIAAASLAIIAPAAYAANVLEVDGLTSPAADVAFAAPLAAGTSISLKTDFNVPASCDTSNTTGYVKRGVTVAAGARIGAITGLSFGGCTLTALAYPMTISKKGTTEWGIFATATPTSKTQATIPVQITGVNARMTSLGAPPYALDLGFTGSITGTFNQNTQVLSIKPPSQTSFTLPMLAYNGAGTDTLQPSGVGTFGGQLYTGDSMQMTGSFQLATPGVGGIKLQ